MITASQVKELRDKTGAGMMDCKKALEETNGDLNKAVDWLREKGIAKAAKKADRIAAEGLTKALVDGNKAIVIEINSETDFVAKNEQFLALLNTLATKLVNANVKTVDEALAFVIDGKAISASKKNLEKSLTGKYKENFDTYLKNNKMKWKDESQLVKLFENVVK